MADRACPVCKVALEDLEESSAARCPSCKGVWVPRSALPAAASGLFQPLLAGFKESDPSDRLQCPDCGTLTLEAARRSAYVIRRCSTCSGVWLEAATLSRLREEISPRWRGFLVSALGKGLGHVIGE